MIKGQRDKDSQKGQSERQTGEKSVNYGLKNKDLKTINSIALLLLS